VLISLGSVWGSGSGGASSGTTAAGLAVLVFRAIARIHAHHSAEINFRLGGELLRPTTALVSLKCSGSCELRATRDSPERKSLRSSTENAVSPTGFWNVGCTAFEVDHLVVDHHSAAWLWDGRITWYPGLTRFFMNWSTRSGFGFVPQMGGGCGSHRLLPWLLMRIGN
jgi:hypothetical protein